MASSNLQMGDWVMNDNLNCVKCKSVPKDACLVPCGCRLCGICINDLFASGVEFCPGPSEECGASPLSQFVTDYRANRNILKFPIKCPNNGCVHNCQLANLEEHLRVCPRKNVECPFRELGCTQDTLSINDMSEHLQQESLIHNEILIAMINNINNEMEGRKIDIDVLNKIHVSNKSEIEDLKKADERNKKDIEILKKTDETNKNEIAMLKHELDLRSGQVKLIMDENILIKEENKVFTDRIKVMIDEMKRDIVESRETSNTKVMDYVKREIQSINQGTQTMKADIYSIKSQMQSKQEPTDDSMTETVLGVLVSAFEKHKGRHGAGRDGNEEVFEVKNRLIHSEPPKQQTNLPVVEKKELRHGPVPMIDLKAWAPKRPTVTRGRPY